MGRNRRRATPSLPKKIIKRICFALTSIDLFGLSSFSPRRLFSRNFQKAEFFPLHAVSFPSSFRKTRNVRFAPFACAQLFGSRLRFTSRKLQEIENRVNKHVACTPLSFYRALRCNFTPRFETVQLLFASRNLRGNEISLRVDFHAGLFSTNGEKLQKFLFPNCQCRQPRKTERLN